MSETNWPDVAELAILAAMSCFIWYLLTKED